MNIGQNLTQQGQQANGVGVNELAQEELVYDAGRQSAEFGVGGVRMDSIPKEGGNKFSGIARGLGSNASLQNDNVTPELRPFIQEGNRQDYAYDFNAVFGGPIKKAKLWFLVAQRVTRTYKSQSSTQRFDVGCSATSFNAVSCISPEASSWASTDRRVPFTVTRLSADSLLAFSPLVEPA